MHVGKQKQEDAVKVNSSTDSPCKDQSASSKASASDSPLRRLRRENHLLRLQLLKLREQQRSLLHNVAVAGSLCSSDDTPTSTAEDSGTPRSASVVTVVSAGEEGSASPAADFNRYNEAAAVRARMLRRQEERHQRTMSARALLLNVEHQHTESSHAQQQEQHVHVNAAVLGVDASPSITSISLTASPPAEVATALGVPAANESAAPLVLPTELFWEGKATTDKDLSAQAMLQRSQSRKAQRQLRLAQMLGTRNKSGTAEDAASATTPIGNFPRYSTSANEDATTAQTNSTSIASGTADGSGAANEVPLGYTINAGGAGAASSHRGARASESAGSAGPSSTYTTRNPNQIGSIVTDAVKNNSWYLCKVLEAALLDTIQSRHAYENSTSPARTLIHPPLPMTSLSVPKLKSAQDGEGNKTMDVSAAVAATAPSPDSGTEGGRERTATAAPRMSSSPQPAGVGPQLLYQVGVSDTALQRAIEESLVLPYRCIHDVPRRLTPQQAGEEAVPPFESENRDSELRRCFAGHTQQDSAERSTRSEANGDGDGDDSSGSDRSALGADDETLDPFARLLLARISTELPSGIGKKEKKQSDHKGGSKQRDDFLQGTFHSSAESGQSFRAAIGKDAPSSGQSASKPSATFVMAAARGDGKVHIPKKHFSRLDEVQVEMHAPVIFNQIRGFLRLDVDRFRRSFWPAGPRGEMVVDGAGSSVAADGQQLHLAPKRQQQRRVRAGAAAAAEEASAWRISVSPGKSGTTLLYFGDYVMKTVRPSEMVFFTRRFLPAYVRYCERNPHTLLPRFYALITVRWWKAGVVQHFVLMHNVLATPYYIHRIYDVKGSTVNRTTLQSGKPPPRTAFGALLLKDNDLPPQLIICGAYQRAILLAQFRSDVDFLRRLRVVDYSCMIGVRSRLFSREEGPSKTIVLQRHQHYNDTRQYVDPVGSGDVLLPLERYYPTNSEVTNVTSEAADAGAQTVNVAVTDADQIAASLRGQPATEDDVYVCIHGCDGGLLSLPIYAPGDDTTAREDVYYLGIIDVLQTYNSAKKLESFAKGFVNDRQAISVIPPEGYSERLYKVLERITV